MKNYTKAVIAFFIIYIFGIVVFVVISGRTKLASVDTVVLNDIVKTIEDEKGSLQSIDSKNFGVDFIVLDMNNHMLYRSSDSVELITVQDAIKRRYPYQYIIKQGTVSGVVIIPGDTEKEYHALIGKIMAALVIGGIIILIGAIGYGFYVNSNIVKPFRRMEVFAGKVAEGRLDEPLMMEKDNMFGVFTESFDIMREELDASKKRELALQRKEKELVASLSHDLKTPITGIKLSTELLKAKFDMEHDGGTHDNKSSSEDSSNTEWVIEKLDNIYKKADQIDVLVSDLFTSTLEDLGEFKVNCQDEDSTVLSEILKKNDDKKLVAEDEIPKLVINIDQKRMNQVIGNIIVNSYKYAGTEIKVSYEPVDKYLEMKIKDFGPGVPEEELELITNKFYRGKNHEVSSKEGSGLGLYIARSLMEKMNGELICENGSEGLIVKLLIPLS